MTFNYSVNCSASATTNHSTTTCHGGPADPFSAEDVKLIATVFFSLISSLGTFGNLLVISTLVRWRDMRTPCNLLIANISVTDLLVSLVMAPLRISEQYEGWILGQVLCYVIAPFQDSLASASVFSHTAIAFERYRAIARPLMPRMNKRKVKVTILFIWLGCYLGTAFPLLFYVRYERQDGAMTCLAYFPVHHMKIYSLYLVMVFILIPLLWQVCCYVVVIRILQKKDGVIHQDSREASSRTVQHAFVQRAKAKKRMIKMLIALMIIFQLCYLPRGFVVLIVEFTPSWTTHSAFLYIDVITILLFYIKHVINPLVLFCMSRDFRDGFIALCRCYTLQKYSFKAQPSNRQKATQRTNPFNLDRNAPTTLQVQSLLKK